MTRLVLADDHPVVRDGLRVLLEQEGGFCVVGEAADGETALQLVADQQPDVLVVDIMMPGLDGLEVTRRVRCTYPNVQVVVVSMYNNLAYVLQARQHGACGYVLKEARPRDLVDAVNAAMQRRSYLSPPLSNEVLDDYRRRSDSGTLDPYDTLTRREREILRYTASGMSAAAIAAELSISPRTVESHRQRVMQKLDLHHQSDLVRFAVQRGIIAP